MIIDAPQSDAATIPLIDLSGSRSPALADRKAVALEIRKACRDPGFFYIAGHGVPAAAMDRQLQLARNFFALPTADKLEVDARLSPIMRGYQPAGIQALDGGTPPDLKEGFLTSCELGEDHPYVRQGVPNAGANQWPRNPPDFRGDFETYIGHMVRLGRRLMGCIALSLDLPEDYFVDGLVEPMFNSQLYHYPPVSTENASRQLGAGAHTDWGMITILLQDDVGGLEIQKADGGWIEAPFIPGTFIINLGEMMPVLTNGLYQARTHRVINNTSGRDRYSVPTFFDPDHFYRVECVPTCLPASGVPALGPVTVGEHIAAMYRKAYGQAA